MSFASLRRVLRSARKGLCSTCVKTKHPQLEAAGAGHVGCLIYTFETLGQLVKDEHDVTAVHVAARKGQISILIYLIENDHVEGVPRAKNGATPVHDAAGTGNLECLRYILSRTKASALDKDANQATPLHWAVQSGHFKVVQWLVLHANASIDSSANNGITPFHLAAAKNYLDILRWLTAHAYRNHPKPRRVINAKDKNGATPLYHASHAGHLKVIQWLAEKGGGDPTIFTTQGLAPMHAATISGHIECVSYLFRFGSATAPGGLRSSEGASALHYAAAEGHVEIIKWLMEQKECTGNERDYYQCTPLHDAAEHGHLKAIQILCEGGADHLLTDIEGNFPKDLAEKHHHTKCAKYLVSREKFKTRTSTTKTDAPVGRGLTRQQKASKAEMIDSYRNAPPHQRPVSVFEEEEDDEFESIALTEDSQWETLHDLMDESELESLSPTDATPSVSSADRKRRNLKENMRREAEARQKKKKELLMREQEYEKEIRERLMAEEQLEDREWRESNKEPRNKKRRKQNKHDAGNNSDVRRLSLPATINSDAMTESGIVEKRAWEFESRTPVGAPTRGTFLSKLWPGKRSTHVPAGVSTSKSWDSSTTPATEYHATSQDSLHVVNEREEYLPTPPPLPTLELLLGKRPPGLRGKGRPSHKLGAGASEDDDEHNISDIDSDHSSVSSTQSDRKSPQKKKTKKKRKRSPKENGILDWQYNKLTVPQSSPPRERKGLARMPTPRPTETSFGGQRDLSSAFDDVSRELELSLLSDSPSSLSPLHSPSPTSPLGSPLHVSPSPSLNQITGHLNKSNGHLQPRQGAQVLSPHQQNSLGMVNQRPGPPEPSSKKTAPISQKGSNRKPIQKQQPAINGHQQQNPGAFMADLNQAMKSSTPPRVTHQLTGYQSSTVSDIQHAPQTDSESDSSEYTSSSDESSSSSDDSSTDDSSDEESGFVRAQVPRRPIMARNIGMENPRHGLGGVTRARQMARYPKLLRKKPIQLATIEEVPEEIVHEAESYVEKARVFRRVMAERKIMKSWRKYMQIMKTIYRKAEKMAQRKRRDLLGKVFYSWVQVRNLGAGIKDDIDRAITYHDKRLMKKVFNAWYFTKFGAKMPIARSTSMQLINAEVAYIEWLNDQLPENEQVDNISQSLADGTLILKALSVAIGKKAPKHNHHPKVQLHRQDNWKVAHEFMKSAGIYVKGIEPADLGNVNPAAIHNMFINILKWEKIRTQHKQ